MKKSQLKLITKIFDCLPSQKILDFARTIQTRLKTEQDLAREKAQGEWVTLADIRIQKNIFKYFSKSLLTKTYTMKGEEKIKKGKIVKNEFWQLLVDPLDGTSSFRRGEQTWGVMIGACDKKGVLQYSWNLVSTGDIFQTDSNNGIKPESFKQKLQRGQQLNIDVYDYGSSASENFGNVFEDTFGVTPGKYQQTSYPSAVWTGWELYQGNLDGLLWIPSDQGKKWYPDYDLIFLGALAQKGFSIRLGKLEDKNAIVVVAPTDEDADIMYGISLRLVTTEQQKTISLAKNSLQITDPL